MQNTSARSRPPAATQPPASLPTQAGWGSLIIASAGIAALVPALLAQGLPATRRGPGLDAGPAVAEEPEQPPGHVPEESGSLAAAPTAGGEAPAPSGPPAPRRRQRPMVNPSSRHQQVAPPVQEPELAESADRTLTTDREPAGDQPLPENRPSAAVGDAATVGDSQEPDQKPVTDKRAQRRAARQQIVNQGPLLPVPGATAAAAAAEAGDIADAAMVRHMSALAASLTEAHRIIHLLNLEKYEAQKELATLKNLPEPTSPAPPVWHRGRNVHSQPAAGAARAGVIARPLHSEGRPIVANRRRNIGETDGELEVDTSVLTEAKQVARRRQIIAASILGAIVLLVLTYNYMDWHWFPNIGDRQALSQLAYIGGFVQIIFMGWMMYRFARIGGKGARWLFPKEEEQVKALRRKRQQQVEHAQLREARDQKAKASQKNGGASVKTAEAN